MILCQQVTCFSSKSTLELFFTNRSSLLNRCEPIPGISDHDTAVYIDSEISIKRQRPTQRKIMLWNKTDLDGLKKEVTSFSDTFLTCLHLRWIIFFKSLYFFYWGELLLFWCFLSNLFFRLVSCFISLLIHGWLYLVDVSFVGI
jgi:hypothetical protein